MIQPTMKIQSLINLWSDGYMHAAQVKSILLHTRIIVV
jgi:hypothetical protein